MRLHSRRKVGEGFGVGLFGLIRLRPNEEILQTHEEGKRIRGRGGLAGIPNLPVGLQGEMTSFIGNFIEELLYQHRRYRYANTSLIKESPPLNPVGIGAVS